MLELVLIFTLCKNDGELLAAHKYKSLFHLYEDRKR